MSRPNGRAVSAALTGLMAFALGAGAYARYNVGGGPTTRHDEQAKAVNDDPEFLREDESTNGATTSRPGDTPSPTYSSTYDPTKGGLAQETSTNTDTKTDTNRSKAGHADDSL